jgi:multimeric flavodoxin WrbA
MNIACLLGSPRSSGNSSVMADRFLRTAESQGAETATFHLNELTFRGCQGCYACKTKAEECVLSDGLTEVLETVKQAAVLVLATPVYYGDISGQMKCFIDRTFSYLKPDYITNPLPSRLAPGKKLVFLMAQGHPDEGTFCDIFPRYEYFLKWYGYSDTYLMRACGVGSGGVTNVTEDILLRIDDTARAVVR